jgi:hypothetical protein
MFAGMPAIVRHAGAPPDHPLTGIPCREIWRCKTLIAGFGHEANQHTGIQYTRCINGCCAIGSGVVDSVEVVMVAAIGLRKENAVEPQAPSPSRREVLARYRHLREISKRHLSDAMKFLSQDAILRHARRLGLARGKTVILDNMDEITLAFDLAIHTAPDARSRAIDRYARSARFAPGSDEALMLEAMRNARFAVVMVQRRHPSVGLIVTDLFRNSELWLVDEGLEMSLPAGTAFATRYYAPDRFVMTAGVGMPIDLDLLTSVFESVPQLLRKSRGEAIADRRFAEAVYRAAIADGIMAGVAYRDPAGTGDDA